MTTITVELNPSQFDVLELEHKFRAFVGGYGSGKSFLGALFLVEHHMKYPGTMTALYEPTFRMLSDIAYPTVEEVIELFGGRVDIHHSDPHIKLFNSLGQPLGIVKCRSLSEPHKIVGYQVSAMMLDEVDTIPQMKMERAWLKAIGRLRLSLPGGAANQALICSTPEGYGWLFDRFVKKRTESYGIVHASTYENEDNLPDGYIESLRESYSEELVNSYLLGQFTHLNAQQVYYSFDRIANHKGLTPYQGEPLHIGIDMNIGNTSATVHIIRDDEFKYHPGRRVKPAYEIPICVDEIVRVRDTPDLIHIIKDRYPRRHITVYPDSSGRSRHTSDADITDIKQLKYAGFAVEAPPSNPRIRTRVANMNAMFRNANGRRRYFVNTDECIEYTMALEQQAYDENGQPDKESGLDHIVDSGGYFITRRFSLSRPITKTY